MPVDAKGQRRCALKRDGRYGENGAGKWVRASAFREIALRTCLVVICLSGEFIQNASDLTNGLFYVDQAVPCGLGKILPILWPHQAMVKLHVGVGDGWFLHILYVRPFLLFFCVCVCGILSYFSN